MLLNFRQEIIEYFMAQGHEIVLVYPKSTETEAVKQKIPKGCRCHAVDVEPSGLNPLKDIRYFFQLKKIYAKERPAIAFHYTIKPNIYGTLAAKTNGQKSVAMVAGLGYVFTNQSFRQEIGRQLYKFGLRMADKVIVLNEYNYNILLEKGFVKKEKLVWFKSGEGVNLEKFRKQ